MTPPPRPPPPALGAALSLAEVEEAAVYGEEEGYEREGLSGLDEDLATCPCRPRVPRHFRLLSEQGWGDLPVPCL